MGQRRREPARRVRREPDGERFFVRRELAARRRDALAAGPRRGPVWKVSLREGHGGRGALVPVTRAGLGALRFLRVPARPRLHDVRDVAVRHRSGLEPLLPRGRDGRDLARVPEERVGAAATTAALGHSRMVLRRRSVPAARIHEALPRDAVRRRPPRDRRAKPHVGRAVRAVRSLEHELSLRQRLFGVRRRRLGSRRQGGVPGPVRQPPRSRGTARTRWAAGVRPARGPDRGARGRGRPRARRDADDRLRARDVGIGRGGRSRSGPAS